MPPAFDALREAALHKLLAEGASRGLFTASSDLSDGGISVALARLALSSGCGISIDFAAPAEFANHLGLFSEGASHVLLGVKASWLETVRALVKDAGCFIAGEGSCSGDRLCISLSKTVAIQTDLDGLRSAYSGALEEELETEVVLA